MVPTRYGQFHKRLVAFLVDSVLSSMIAGILFIPLLLIFIPKFLADSTLTSLLTGHGFGLGLLERKPEFLAAPLLLNIALFALVFGGIGLLYFAIFESGPRQATPGKMMLGLFVTDQFGRRISFQRALGRNLARVLSKMFCYLGYIIALFTERSQALHDFIAGTLVLEPAVPAPGVAGPAPPASVPGPAAPPSAPGGNPA